MSTFEQVLEAQSCIPKAHVNLPLDSFAADWHPKPQGEVCFGLRMISNSDIQTARAEAAKFALEMHDDHEGRIEAYNDALMSWLVVRGTCEANDLRMNAPIFEGSEVNVRNALTSEALRFLWDHIDRFHITNNPSVKLATDEDFLAISILIRTPNALDALTASEKNQFRKLAGYLLEKLNVNQPDPEPESEEEGDFVIGD